MTTAAPRHPIAVVQIATGLVLLVAAAGAWASAGVAESLAAFHDGQATLATAAADERQVSGWLSPVAAALDPDVRQHAAMASYWAGDYASLTDRSGSGDAAAASLLHAANAAFRRAQREAERAWSPDRLDQVLQAYASVLKNHGFDRDASYNYEYVARLRDRAARAKPPATTSDAGASRGRQGAAARRGADLPPGPTIHGRPGTHPPATRGDEFEVITPMDFGDREAQPEPTPGVRMPKKG